MKKAIKKIVALVLAAAVCISLAACGSAEQSSASGNKTDLTGQTFVVGFFGNLPDRKNPVRGRQAGKMT